MEKIRECKEKAEGEESGENGQIEEGRESGEDRER